MNPSVPAPAPSALLGVGRPQPMVLLAFQCSTCGLVTTDLIALGGARVQPNPCPTERCQQAGLSVPRLAAVQPVLVGGIR